MKLLADLHISPATVEFLRRPGHDIVRVSEIMSPKSADAAIVAEAVRQGRVILTQDLDFSAIIALGRLAEPSVLSLRLSSSRIEHVNAVLETVLPMAEQELIAGAVVAVEEHAHALPEAPHRIIHRSRGLVAAMSSRRLASFSA